MLQDSEILEEKDVSSFGYETLGSRGWVKITHMLKTIPLRTWRLETARGRCLICAHHHLVMTGRGLLAACEVTDVDVLETEQGPDQVTASEDTEQFDNLYDLRVEAADHLYYSGGILSHNSTGVAASEYFKFNAIPNYRMMYIAPMPDHVKTFATLMIGLQRGSVYTPELYRALGLRDNMYDKESPKGGYMKLVNVLSDPSRVRGNSMRTVIIDEAQGFDPRFLPEIRQVQKAFREQRYTVFSGTALDLDTCLQMQFDRGSRGIWHVRCGCKDKFHPLNDVELIPKMMTPSGLRCPNTNLILDTGKGLFVHEDTAQVEMNNISLHLPQIIVPEYSQGAGFLDIWNDYENYPYQKFLREVMGIATEEGVSELTKAELLNCCTDKGFKETQAQITPTRSPYKFIVSGCDWGGSDTLSDAKAKISYTVHVIYGLHSDGHYDLLYANRYNTVNYREIAQHIVEVHNRFKAFAIGADDGGGAYYNAYLRDCGRIPNERVITFAYTDTQMFIKRLDHPEIQKLSLHRTDSLSAFIGDIKDQKVRFPKWGESATFLQDCLNMRRNMTTSNSGRTVMRYLRKATASDDFMHASNFALMVLRILTRQPSIPNKELMDEMARRFGTMAHSPTQHDLTRMTGGLISG